MKHTVKAWNRFFRMKTGLLFQWLSDHIRERNYQILAAIIIGVVSGLVAVFLKYSAHTIRNWLIGNDPTSEKFGLVIYPAIGILLTVVFVRFIIRKNCSIGLSSLIHSISGKRVNIPPFETYLHVISSSLTVGFGGAVGLEAPIIRTGSAIGSNLARLLRVGRKKQLLFLGCGAAAGMSAIFNSPVAGVIFVFEVLLTEIALPSFIPLLISAATGAVVAKMLYYEQIFYIPTEGWAPEGVPFYLVLGILCGLLSAYMIRMTLFVDSKFRKYKNPFLKIAIGGLALGLLIFLMPPLFGEGYQTINDLLSQNWAAVTQNSLFYGLSDQAWFLILFLFIAILTKAIAASITMAIGGNGGIFAPAMFSGAALGFIFAFGINQFGWVNLPVSNFIVVAMAGILSGVIKSPLTGIFLIAEITSSYVLFVPLMIVSAISYFVTYYFEPHSIFTKKLYSKGLWVPTHERDKRILKNMDIEALVERNFKVLHPDQTLGEFVEIIAKSKRSVFPVTRDDGTFLGIILLDDVRHSMFKTELYKLIKVKDLMHNPPDIVDVHEPMEKAMKKFDYHKAWNLPVVQEGKYLGFVSKSSVLNKYRELLVEKSEEM